MSDCSKLKILHLIDTAGQGGAEQVLYSLLEKLGNEEYEHHVFLSGPGWLHDKLITILGIKIVFCDGGGRFNFGYMQTIAEYLINHHIQLIHSHLFGSSLYASITGFFCRVPVVCTFHGYIDCCHEGRLQNLKLNLISLFARRIVAVSDGLKDFLVSRVRIGRDKFVTIHNGIDTESRCSVTRQEARRSFGFSDSDILIGSIGNVKPAKGYEVLLNAAKIVADNNHKCRFIIAGNTENTYFDKLLKLTKDLALEGKVFFLGFVENTNKFLHVLDLFVLSSDSEGFSLATIEAMNAGIPVVATRSGGPQEIITNMVNGILVQVGDANELAASINQMINNPAYAGKMVDNAKKEVLVRFTIESVVRKYEEEYYNLLCK